mgnify:CR=1 FL=1
MSFISNFHRIECLEQLIRLKATGTPDQLAERLGVSRRTVFNLIENLRQMGKDIKYDPNRKTYYYDM